MSADENTRLQKSALAGLFSNRLANAEMNSLKHPDALYICIITHLDTMLNASHHIRTTLLSYGLETLEDVVAHCESLRVIGYRLGDRRQSCVTQSSLK